ncbi:Protein CBR-CLEC-90 [Caenorhabditis briggsae]|uniref:Protein CBR-CLEC-90 n=1 Tax=Caenorhabditis briggsae TaxID=6238 RepID=A8WVT7_CAEBR|nr:Protein CBR-CLEC-90 [Caenorhabditis briggsae]CAP24750.2 Protein CBR-CLEC-90 [Caenorhabditis briggsae]
MIIKNEMKLNILLYLQVSRAHAYIPILKQISKDMIEICERTQALKKRTRQLESTELSRDFCCKATPIMCQSHQVCLRALVYSPYGNFFLSGCHPEEDHLSGCDFHSLPHNSSVHRCVCKDGECQNDFPGDCPIKGITDTTKPVITTTLSPTSTPPCLIARNRTKTNSARNRHHHNHSMTSSSAVSSTILLSIWVIAVTTI